MKPCNITRRQFLHCVAASTAAVAVGRDGIEDPITVTPEESDALLVNPGIGIETFWSFQGDRVNYDREVENYPRSSIAYFHYYWIELEEAEGQCNFEEIDFLLKKARKRGQDIALRFMGFNFGRRYLKYLMEKARGYEVELEAARIYPRTEKVPTWAPDFNDPYFLEPWEVFLASLGWHASSFNGKSTMLPSDQIPAMERFLKRCGYRLVLRRFTTSHQARINAGLRVQMQFENVGVAPPYKNYTLAIRLKNDRRVAILRTDPVLTRWLPGQHTVDARLSLPRSLKPGDYDVAVGCSIHITKSQRCVLRSEQPTITVGIRCAKSH